MSPTAPTHAILNEVAPGQPSNDEAHPMVLPDVELDTWEEEPEEEEPTDLDALRAAWQAFYPIFQKSSELAISYLARELEDKVPFDRHLGRMPDAENYAFWNAAYNPFKHDLRQYNRRKAAHQKRLEKEQKAAAREAAAQLRRGGSRSTSDAG